MYICSHYNINRLLTLQYNYYILLIWKLNSRLLPKKIFREPFGLPKLEIGSPKYISRSQRLFSQIQTMSYETYSLDWKGVVPPRGGGGDSNIKKVGMLVENFEIDPYGKPIWAWLVHFLLLKETNLGVAPAFFDPLKVNKMSLKTRLLHFFACNSKRDLKV